MGYPLPLERHISAGLDLGKRQDHSVLCVTETTQYYLGLFKIGEKPSYIDEYGIFHPSEPKLEKKFRTTYTVRHIEQVPLETPYYSIAERAADVLSNLPIRESVSLFVDRTGVGDGVYEIIKAEFKKRPDCSHIRLYPVSLTSGRQEYSMSTGTMSKYALISRLLRLMGAEIPDLIVPSDLQALIPAMNELRNFQEKVAAETGNSSYDGKSGIHDDIVIALGLSVLVDSSKMKVRYSNRVY